MILGILILIIAVFNIAGNSIGIQCASNNPTSVNPNSYNFLVFNLVLSILLVLISMFGLYTRSL